MPTHIQERGARKALKGRPATGQTPGKDRTAKSAAALKAAGGKRLSVNLTPVAAAALREGMLTLGLTETTAVNLAMDLLRRHARRRSK